MAAEVEHGKRDRNRSRERVFDTLTYDRLYIDEIDDAAMLANRAEDYPIDYIAIRPQEALAWNRPLDMHLRIADPTILTFQTEKSLSTS